jgi:hypothetical protein
VWQNLVWGSQYGTPDGQSLSDEHAQAPPFLWGLHTFEQQSELDVHESRNRPQVRQFLTLVFGTENGPLLSHDTPAGAHIRTLLCAHGVVPDGQPQTLWDLS